MSTASETAVQATSAEQAEVIVRARDIARFFDVSPPWLNRVLEKKGRSILRAVDGVDFEIRRGETLSLVGESGCGKSTVARLLVGLYRPTRGSVEFFGRDLREIDRPEGRGLRQKLQMIFQDPYASLNPRWRVADIIAEPLRTHGLGGSPAEVIKRVDPEFLVCDEPTSALDVSVQAQVLNLMKDLQRELGLTYLFISHNLAVVRHISDRVGVMYLGKLVELAPKGALFEAPRHPYTRMLLDAIPDLAMTGRARTPVAGEVPNPLNPPSGCTFHPRCPLANARCKSEAPVIRVVRHAAGESRVACHAVEEGRSA
jgi:peptide/nickel transport system ATP-binding protein